MNRRALLGQCWRHCVLILCSTFSIFPIIWIFSNSLKTSKEILRSALELPGTYHFENYLQAWTEGSLGKYMLNSVIICGISTVIVVVCATLAAYAFARLQFKGRRILFSIVLAGMALPPSARLAPLMSMLNVVGLTNTRIGLILVYSGGISFAILMMRSFFLQFPRELEEAAEIDGANRMVFLTQVLLPLSMPPLSTLTVFTFLNHWKEFLFAFMLTSSNEVKTLPVGLMVFQGAYTRDYALSFAGIIISALPMMLLYIVFQKGFINGVTAGSSK